MIDDLFKLPSSTYSLRDTFSFCPYMQPYMFSFCKAGTIKFFLDVS